MKTFLTKNEQPATGGCDASACHALTHEWLDRINALSTMLQEKWWMSPHYRLQVASEIEGLSQCCLDLIDKQNDSSAGTGEAITIDTSLPKYVFWENASVNPSDESPTN